VTVTEHAWAGYGTPLVWCYATEDGTDYAEVEVEVEGWSADFAIPAGEHVVCQWFNIPEYDQHHTDGGNIVVTKWVCPDGDEVYDLSLDELHNRCDETVEGVDFLLYGPAAGWQDTTDVDGRAAFGPLTAGDYRLSEDLPAGYGEPIVYCWQLVGSEALSYETAAERAVVGGQNEVGIDVEIESGTTWFCDWFNVPAEVKKATNKHRQTIVKIDCNQSDNPSPACNRSRGPIVDRPATIRPAASRIVDESDTDGRFMTGTGWTGDLGPHGPRLAA
jgi:hypothetical protein